MKLRLILPGILALALLLAACAPPPVLRDPAMLNDNSLITNEPCEAPCWRGITPGETRWSDALTIVEDDPNLDDPETQTAQDNPAIGAQWQKKDGAPCCQMISQDGAVVTFISVRLAPDFTLGEVIEVQGEPTYAIGAPVSDDQAVLYVFYPEKSLIVVVFVAGESARVSSSSEIIGALYSTPADMELSINTSKLHAWEGYAPFATYKSDLPDEEFEVTPSVTLTPTPGQ